MDYTGEIQLQKQISSLRNTIEQEIRDQKQQVFAITNILFSGNNVDAQGNKILNPMLQSNFRYIKHIDGSLEQIMQIGGQQDWWQSNTFPGEFVQLLNEKVITRFNQDKQFFTDFDYRFVQTQYTRHGLRQIYQRFVDKKIKDSPQWMMNCSLEQLYNVFNYLQILIGYTGDKFIDPTKHRVSSLDNLILILKQVQIIIQAKLIKESIENDQSDLFDSYLVTETPKTSETIKVVNILQNAIHNVYISGSENIYLSPQGRFQNIFIKNSSRVQLFDSQNVTLNGCNNINIKESINQGEINLTNVNNMCAGKQFCNFGGKFRFNNSSCTDDDFIIISDESFKSSDFRFQELIGYNIFIDEKSFSYSNGIILGINNFQMTANKVSLINSQINIRNSFHNGYLHVGSGCCLNGSLICVPGSFNGGIMSFRVRDIQSFINYQKIRCEKDMKIFYMQDSFKDINILEGTEYIIQNSLSIIVGDSIHYDNGPFQLEQINLQLRENSFINPTPTNWVKTASSTKIDSNWIGYQCIDTAKQTLLPWGNLFIDVTKRWINILSSNGIYYPITNIEYLNKQIIITADLLPHGSVIDEIIFTLSGQQSYDQIIIKGNPTAQFINTSYDITVDQSFIDLNIFNESTRSIKFTERDQNITSVKFRFSTKEKQQSLPNLEQIEMSDYLISKLFLYSYMFAGSVKYNPVKLINEMSSLSVGCFYGCRGLNQTLSYDKDVPDYCFAYSNIKVLDLTSSIGQYAYQGSDVIQVSTGQLNKGSFKDCSYLSDVSLKFEQQVIPEECFMNDSQLRTIHGFDKIKTLEINSLRGCSSFDSDTLLENISSFGQYCCSGSGIKSIKNRNQFVMDQVGGQFSDCKQLISINILMSTVPANCFDGCVSLNSIKLNGEKIILESYSFSGCRSLENIPVAFYILGEHSLAGTCLSGYGSIKVESARNQSLSQLVSISRPLEISLYNYSAIYGLFDMQVDDRIDITIHCFSNDYDRLQDFIQTNQNRFIGVQILDDLDEDNTEAVVD